MTACAPSISMTMVNKAFNLVITTLKSSFGEPFGGAENGVDPILWTPNLRLKPVSTHLQLPIHVHTN